jgi:hypothetical protein
MERQIDGDARHTALLERSANGIGHLLFSRAEAVEQQCSRNGTASLWERKDGWNLFAVFKDEVDHFRYWLFAIGYSFDRGCKPCRCWQRVGRNLGHESN